MSRTPIMMGKLKVQFVERKFDYFVSVENVFRRVSEGLDPKEFETDFQQLPYPNTLTGMLRNLVFFRPNIGPDVFHVTGHCHYIALVLPRDKTVLTIHDLGFLHTRYGLRRWALKKLLLDLPARRLKYITVISEATRDEIEQTVPSARGKVRVIDNPLDDRFEVSERREFNQTEPRILQVGTAPNKNVENLVRAVSGLSCVLVLIGEVDEDLRSLLSEGRVRYEVRSQLTPEQLRKEYDECDIVAFCSTYEGFGLPVIEGQAMRRPVVTSDLRPMREVAGDGGAVLVDPRDPADIRKGIETLICDPSFRERLVENGTRNVARFDKGLIASRYAELYREVAGVDRRSP